ncbi:MFS transporter [Cocleimonas flava]|uniref:YNFM family putative membrane transporter n=1 Tax=Cocleimonas flava TaxID=634765 RepID=A0A4R1EU54_9GAMM|nr:MULTISPECIES: MFS transporter [Cocleimonas]MEB8433161.1 MFS transporter [Cocleimonas sp. KMM 6892]MEC4715858.1 MFS transporter [Cocleimonas sp. KMM 6895]MEC4745319.1 MFS transporter [Cocleimonas sp. KMM 6896]TCJ82628.1 YNFM family putative membrane transporter [Cocleimonas flava]
MTDTAYFRIKLIVFALVSASFTNVYITQPVLPVLQDEFAVDLVMVSFSISGVILGIALSNLPFGMLIDRYDIQPIVLVGGTMVAAAGLVCALTDNFWVLIAARFVQGLFIPALTTCLAAYLAKTIPLASLSVVMGSYVSATVLGGLGGRLLGGWIHPPLHWRYAFITASVFILIATFMAVKWLPKPAKDLSVNKTPVSFVSLLKRKELFLIFLCALGSFSVFSSVFNYLPFRLEGAPFNFSTESITLVFLVYITGIFMGPTAGRLSNRFGSGNTLLLGSGILAVSLLVILMQSVVAIVIGLIGVCMGFFMVHAAAVGALNKKLTSGHGRANALYVLFYYIGGGLGITAAGFAYKQGGWNVMILLSITMLIIPVLTGLSERKQN